MVLYLLFVLARHALTRPSITRRSSKPVHCFNKLDRFPAVLGADGGSAFFQNCPAGIFKLPGKKIRRSGTFGFQGFEEGFILAAEFFQRLFFPGDGPKVVQGRLGYAANAGYKHRAAVGLHPRGSAA